MLTCFIQILTIEHKLNCRTHKLTGLSSCHVKWWFENWSPKILENCIKKVERHWNQISRWIRSSYLYQNASSRDTPRALARISAPSLWKVRKAAFNEKKRSNRGWNVPQNQLFSVRVHDESSRRRLRFAGSLRAQKIGEQRNARNVPISKSYYLVAMNILKTS